MFFYWILKPFLLLLNHLPLKALDTIGVFLGSLIWILSADRRKVAAINAKIIGAEDPKKTAKESFKNAFKAYMETFYANRINEKFVEKYVMAEGSENFYTVRENNKEYILAGAHFGPWSMFANIATLYYGFKVITIGRASKNKTIERVIEELRSSANVRYITHRGAIAQLSKFMEEGYIPGVYLDHTATPKDCVNVDFFGYKTPTIAGIPAFAAKKRIPIIMFFCIYEKNGYKIKIYPAIYPDETLKPKERIEKLAGDINKVYEDIFRKYPEQWYLIHRRFKRVEEPDGTISHSVYR